MADDTGRREDDRLIGELIGAVKAMSKDITEIKESQGDIYEKVNDLATKVAKLEVKSGIWGSIGGIVVVIGAILLNWIAKGGQ